MEDPTSSLFQLALGLTPPWEVERLDFDADRHRLDIHIGFRRGARFPCPEGEADCPVHDTAEKEGATSTSSSTRPTCTPGSRASDVRITACARWRCPGRGRGVASRCSSKHWPCC